MKPLLVSSGEPAGIGPDICLSLMGHDYPLVVLADPLVLQQRADALGIPLTIEPYQPSIRPTQDPQVLTVCAVQCPGSVTAGQLDAHHAPYVMEMLKEANHRCLQGEFAALVTAPVHKGVINQAGIPFTGHTEFFAEQCGVETVVMMFASKQMNVALVTTHLPLREVPDAINSTLLTNVIQIVHSALKNQFAIPHPHLLVAGLNPHAGEGGFLGQEELLVITPTIQALRQQGIDVSGPYPADTLFFQSARQTVDAYIAMYHDQGLPVIKYADFQNTVNITLGLPYIRTSVDHGTALELAGKGIADSRNLLAAVDMAVRMHQGAEGDH